MKQEKSNKTIELEKVTSVKLPETKLTPRQIAAVAAYVIPINYVMPAGTKEIVEIWRHGSNEQKVENMLKVKKQFNANGIAWGADATLIALIASWADLMDILCKDAKGFDASIATRTYRNEKMVEALYFFKHYIHQFCQNAVADPDNLMQLVDMNLMGFLFQNQNQGHHDRWKIPTEILTLKILPQTVAGQLKLIFERNALINSEEGGGKARPNGVAGVVVAYKPVSASIAEWHYVNFSKLHETLALPPEWNGETIHIKAAYYAHLADDKNLLPWCTTQTIILIRDVTDVTTEAAKEIAALKAQLEAEKAELEALRNATKK